MKNNKSQSAIECLMTHTWAIAVLLTVGLVLSYLGVFETTARPRFEGLQSSAIQPIPDKVRLYSDGVLVLTVQNMKPHSINVDWVKVAPTADPNDVIQTNIGITMDQGELEIFEIDGSNLHVPPAAASAMILSETQGKVSTVDPFILEIGISYTIGNKKIEQVISFVGKFIEFWQEAYNVCLPGYCNKYSLDNCLDNCQQCENIEGDNCALCTDRCEEIMGVSWYTCVSDVDDPEGICFENPIIEE